MGNLWGQPFGDVKLKRARRSELVQAIADLEERGYELIRQGRTHKSFKSYTHKQETKNHLNRNKYDGDEVSESFYAVMRKKPAKDGSL